MASSSRRKYDVFISFRGEDTRYNFLSHLHKALLQKRIETYVDERLERGDEISRALLKAIEESEVSVIIFSENYASSSWCLDELVHIMFGCKEKNVVVPIFYHVTPSDVRKQSGRFGDAFAELVKRSKDKEKLWRTALTKAANLCGWDAQISRSESKLVEKIIENISEKLRSSRLDYHVKGLVGVEKRVDRVKSLLMMRSLLINSSSDVRIVGIWGMGGLGKTTLVDIIFSQFHSQFEGYCFLKNVREEWQKQGSIYLQNKLFSELLMEEKGLRVINNFARERLHRKRVLIILDDVDDPEYFEYLVGGRDWLCPGSRIIVTTRNRQVLTNIGVDEMYALEHLNEDEALHLFSLKAFKRNSPLASYEEMSRKVISYAQGVPLALKVLGCHLCSKSESIWRSALNRLKVAPHDQKIHDVLKISYDGLRDIEKEIFLDIACFFKRERIDVVQEMLDDFGVFEDVITVLIDNCLITITWHGGLIEMHDMIQEMAWKIVSKDCKELPAERRERLLDADDIIHVLNDHTGPTKVKGILLNMSRLTQDVNLKPEAFKELHYLRFLKIMHNREDEERCKLHFPQGINILPRTLRYLSWVGFPSLSLPSSFMARNLVKLHMPWSQLEQLWNGSPDLVSLKYVTLRHSKKLVSIPDLSQANLKILDLSGCTSLVEIPSLRFQRASDNLETNLKNLRMRSYFGNGSPFDNYDKDLDDYTLDLSDCINLKTLSRMSGGIRHLNLGSTAVEELDCSNWSLENLVSLDLNECKCLKSLPSNICKFDSLEKLNLRDCVSFNKFPTVLPKNIKTLDLNETAIQEVPSSVSFECLSSLDRLSMADCTRLETLPTEIFKLKSLSSLDLSGCSELKSFPEILEPHERLSIIKLDGSGIKELPLSIENLQRLFSLSLKNCENLESVPDSICNINGLRLLDLSKCPKLQTLPAVTWASFFPEITLDISYKIITKILEWLCYGSSSLPVLDPSEPISERITVCIRRFFNSIYFEACGYATCQSRPRCKFFSRSKIGQYAFCPYCNEFCRPEDMAVVMSKFQPYFLQAATEFPSKPEEQDEGTKCPGIGFCHRGSKIPKWFDHQSDRSSIDLSFSRDWYNTSFLGFAVCIHVEFQSFYECDLNFTCEYHFKTNRGDSTFQKSRVVHSIRKISFCLSDHIFAWYLLYKNYHDYHEAIEASFQFFVERLDSDTRLSPIIKNCGIRILYRQDIGILQSSCRRGTRYC
ncbi:disease resistance-like protein DSC1 isoform X2 [Morus notabilis]|uniref:disease resistance-like protein DSC1 isoform X2 n=1 Tax=Morus notabilis TaxID=981085 RepID=UPI000CECEC4A|nr:disease resistance-like protein DSC1 isoform X2 [Morus notabilis]